MNKAIISRLNKLTRQTQPQDDHHVCEHNIDLNYTEG